MIDKILIASGNKHKQEKLRKIVRDLFQQVDLPEELKMNLDISEDGNSFEENAIKKAVEYSKLYDGYVIATDAGMSIPALGDKWNGLYTRRFAGKNATDFDRITILLNLMKDLKGKEREMTWKEAVAIAKEGKTLFSIEVDGIKGHAAETYDPQKYKEGIWMCSIWFFPQWNKNFFDLSKDEIDMAEISWKKLKIATNEFFKTVK